MKTPLLKFSLLLLYSLFYLTISAQAKNIFLKIDKIDGEANIKG